MNVQPEVVVTHYLDKIGADHQDHIAVASIVRNICMRKPFVTTLLGAEPLQPFTDFRPSFFVDITEQLPEKIEALELHASQNGRAYLTEDFHRTRGSRWGPLVKTAPVEQPRVFETFSIEQMVWA